MDRDDVAAALGLARHLDRGLVGLGPGVGEVHAAAERGLREPPRQLGAGRAVKEVADVDQRRGLLA